MEARRDQAGRLTIMLRAAFLLAVVALSGCGAPAPVAMTVPAVASSPAVAALARLTVQPARDVPGYTRKAFLPHGWDDPDGNGCDARRDALARQAVADVVRAGVHRCVLTATILDPYTGKRIPSTKADADHVVPLAAAWGEGASAWTGAQRERFGNDPMNLVATSASLNRSKADKTADRWMPPLESYRCPFAARIVAVKARYRLAVAPAERDAIARVLATCPAQDLPRT